METRQRGYVSFGKESAKGKKEGDLKEFWHFGQYVENNPSLEEEYPKNVFVEELPRFNEIGRKTYRLLEKTAKHEQEGRVRVFCTMLDICSVSTKFRKWLD